MIPAMQRLRKSGERGQADHGWLKARHSFSFADYFDPNHMGYRSLRVINEDRVAPGAGFPMHGHRDMEILTWMLDGALEHRDSMGNGSVIRPGELQYMCAGTGVRHSEFNHSDAQGVHLLQIWLLPERAGLQPRYDQRDFKHALEGGEWVLLASPDGEQGAIRIHQDAQLLIARADGKDPAPRTLAPGRGAWIHCARGSITINGTALQAGDALAVEKEPLVTFKDARGAEVLFFDLA